MERFDYDGLQPVATGHIYDIEHSYSGVISFVKVETVPKPGIHASEYKVLETGRLPDGLEGMADIYEDQSDPDVMKHIIETATGFRVSTEVPMDFVRDPKMRNKAEYIEEPPKRRWWSKRLNSQ